METARDTRPNILLLLTDQQRFDAIQSLGDAFKVPTPNIDVLVGDGVTFANCHCTAPICSPSRSTLITGLMPSEAGMPGNLHGPSQPLSPALPTIGKRLRAAGYETAYHGKWHMGGHVRDYGFEHGEECSHDETTRLMAARFWRDRDWMEHERPFFHVVSFLDPHDLYFFDPEEGKKDYKRPWQNLQRPASDYPATPRDKRVQWDEATWSAYHQFYAQRIAKVDRDIGLLLDDLRCSGFFPNTWIFFTSDHGDMAGEQNIPFKGPFMYEGVTRVPLVVIPPRHRIHGDFARSIPQELLPVGRRTESLCSLIDIVPSLLDLAGIEPSSALEGRSLLPWVREEKTEDVHDSVFAEWCQPEVRMVRTAEWKYVRYNDGGEELFHLAEDPTENSNLAAASEFSEVKADLVKRSLQLRES